MRKYIESVKNQGADLALLIDAGSIIVEAWPVMKCRYGCPRYNTSFCCPPNSPTWKETREILSCYNRGILFRTSSMTGGTKIATDLSAELARDGFYKSFAFGIGPCTLCQECSINEGSCRHPGQAAPSMEACGIDVIATVRAQGIEMKSNPGAGERLSCWGLVMVD